MTRFFRPSAFLRQEALAMLERLDAIQPFSMAVSMVPAAEVSREGWRAIERHLDKERLKLRRKVVAFIGWLSGRGAEVDASKKQRRFTTLRMEFNNVLSQLDIFSEALTQRSEHRTGVWLAGLDVLAADALRISPPFAALPPVVTYLDRGHGAAIRRINTRLPGGSNNPVTVIRMPRERMVGSGIASSLVHECGHQAAAMLDLVPSLQAALARKERSRDLSAPAWRLWRQWISEIVADFWAVGKLGIAATLGLVSVVSLPKWFVFRVNLDDPHPFPWIRARVSCAIGRALYPDPQWARLDRLWRKLYPVEGASAAVRKVIVLLEQTMQPLVDLILAHRPAPLGGHSLQEIMPVAQRQAERLRRLHAEWYATPIRMCGAAPSLVFAVLGQARADGKLGEKTESRVLAQMLTHWAVSRRTVTGGLPSACPWRAATPALV